MANKRSLNRVILIGNVGKDPEITHIPSLDKDVAKFSVATTEVFMDRTTNQFQDITEWHNVVAWGYTAKKVERGVNKGSLVLVEGKIKTRKWKDQNEQDRWSTEIVADSVTVLDRSGRESNSGSYSRSTPTPSAAHYDAPGPATPQAPPEMQIDDMDIPYDDSDPF
jgi:single-strand DNA-binding protein